VHRDGQVADYPGLLRVIAWMLNGLGMRVHNACLKTTSDGIAEDSFWLTDYAGRKVHAPEHIM
jgi:UTP:GlnB (protein PII) uridylyltransferase